MPGIEEDNNPMSKPEDKPEDKLPVNVIPDEGESVRLNERLKSSDFMYHKKDANTDTSEYDRVLNAFKKSCTL